MSGVFTLSGQLRLVGAVLIVVGLAHLVMPRGLGWRPEFAGLRALTRQIMYTHTYFIGLSCVLLGLAPLALTNDLLAPGRLPAAVLIAECVFLGPAMVRTVRRVPTRCLARPPPLRDGLCRAHRTVDVDCRGLRRGAGCDGYLLT